MAGRKAAMYLRMSDPRQECSTEIQEKLIRNYADNNGIEIVRAYADEGKSGVVATGRNSFQKLIADVKNREAELDFHCCWFMTFPGGAVSNAPMKAPIMNTSAALQGWKFITLLNNSQMMARPFLSW